MGVPPTRAELLLAIEALAALVEDAYPALPLPQLARGLDTYRDSLLTPTHYKALGRVEQLVLGRPEPCNVGGDEAL